MSAWPDLTEYHEAVQNPAKAFSDSGLKEVTLELDRFGMPKPVTGGNAVVYKAEQPGGLLSKKRNWAIRCFLRPISDHAERYDTISKHLKMVHLPYGVGFHYLQQGIHIRKTWFPIVKMQWVDGDLFHTYIEKNLKRPQALAALRDQWVALLRTLEVAKIAHGDLQHGNILVRNGSLVLVDYDGMWVPRLGGRKATEIGHRAYQHPLRTETDYGPEIDRFSSLVIYLSIVALAHNPKLWEEFHTGDNLIFVREDFVNPESSRIWQQLRGSGSDQIERLATAVQNATQMKPIEVPNLDYTLKNLGAVKAQPIKAQPPKPAPAKKAAPPPAKTPTKPAPPPPAPAAKPAAAAKAAPAGKQNAKQKQPAANLPSWMNKTGYRDNADD